MAVVTNTKLRTSIFYLLSNKAISLPFVSVSGASLDEGELSVDGEGGRNSGTYKMLLN